ncbi:hypothetical protein EV217_4877 [Phyllobacterium myrsinacearum]|uniref:hypothetical protein n=1 Tax=Phyllobacterium myrsinacearum TaxID=28101 RepID=UPI00102990EC|nr:hypothetical protein [Phyllobacterium myrsinacearum]RZS76662.1 hypothetical protein EV217_4877 [Phyllobacterium myrsinacearum]
MQISQRPPEIVSLRVLQMLDGIERAGFAPISFRSLHSFAYVGNLLSPLWDVDPLDGKILKQGYPYYPELRVAIDGAIFCGLIDLTKFEAANFEGEWVAEGEIGLNYALARPILDDLDVFSDEVRMRDFLYRLALALAPSAEELPELIMSDVTWTDNRTGRGDIIDYAETKEGNYTANTVRAFDELLPKSMASTKGEKLQFYVRLLEKRATTRADDVKKSA